MKPVPVKSILFLFLLAPFSLKSQQPILKLKGADSASVLLTHLKTEVKVIGNYAITTMEMKFCNSSDRILEGELIFPMPDGVSISRYAIDINGKMREAVPVEKEKGQVVFENIVRRNVDPGLLEKVDGNNFRTRIYPIPANGCRTVLIGYEQLLSLNSNYAFVYSLPLHFKEPIKQFDFSITVASNYIPEVGSDCNTNLKFEELNKVFTSSVSKQDFMPDGAFTINVPKTADAAEISMQSVNGQYYFLLNTFPQVKKIEKKIPNVISVIWDASLSGMNRDHKKEFELLDAYIKAKGSLTINLFKSDIDIKKLNTYSILNGNWSELRKTLEDIDYDGASNLSNLANLPGANEYLFFTDGLHNWGNIDNMVLTKSPIYTICAAATADYSLLKYISAATGGTFINLNESDIATAQKYLTEQTLQFLGIKPAAGISEVYPSVVTPLVNGCSIAGISNTGNAGIFLQYGYGSTVTFEQYIDMNFSAHNTKFINIEKIWAQKKMAELDIQYEKNKEAITALGKKYTIITRNTSLIVLDAVEDYVRYDIEPPAELMGAYTKLVNERRSVASGKEKDVLEAARTSFINVQAWWDRNFKPSAQTASIEKKSILSTTNTNQRILSGRPGSDKYIRDSIAAKLMGYVKQGADGNEYIDWKKAKTIKWGDKRIMEKIDAIIVTPDSRIYDPYNGDIPINYQRNNTNGITSSVEENSSAISYPGVPIYDSLGTVRYSNISADRISTVSADTMFFNTGRASAPPTVADTDGDGVTDDIDKCINERGPASNFGCPVISEGIIKRTNLSTKNVLFRKNSAKLESDLTLKSSRDAGKRTKKSGTRKPVVTMPPPPPPPADVAKEEKNDLTKYVWTDTNDPAEINITELIPERPYLEELGKLSKENKYKKYLELRKDNNESTFYFDVANMFFRDADTATGYRILSNIAELNLDDHESCKMLGYRLKNIKRYDDEVMIFKKVMQMRPQDPQSYRDYALALADVGKFQQSLDTLYFSLTRNYDDQIKNLYPGFEEIVLTEINELIALHGSRLNTSKIPAELIQKMPVDIRVVLNWNMNDTDVDLWVFDPAGEKCYFSNKQTRIGGRISRDCTRGYGPEHFMLKNTIKGKYKVMVNYFGNTRQRPAGRSTVMLEVFTHYGTTSVQRKVVAIQMEGKGSGEVLVAEFSF